MKRTPLKRKSKSETRKIQDLLWEECKRIIRRDYGNVCYTCGKTELEGSNWHTGHLLPKASVGAYLKYDLRILRPQCYFCNVNCGGRGAEFIEKMRALEGDKYVDQIIQDKNKIIKASDYYIELLERYKQL